MAQQNESPNRKCSPKQKPLRAVLPITSVTKDVSTLNWKSENSSPLLLSPTIFGKNRALSGLRSPDVLNSKVPVKSNIRRTASFDSVYSYDTNCPSEDCLYAMLMDNSTQTNDRVKSSGQNINDERLQKFFRQRFQRKDSYNFNPFGSTPPTEHITTQTMSHCVPDTAINKTIRNSVEGLNQEIERLVLSNVPRLYGLKDKEISEGHKAPLAEILRSARSVNTQTPGEAHTPNSISSGPPSRGDSDSPLRPVSQDSSPGDEEVGSKSGASPKINKFLAREPPDGCEKVNLKFYEDLRRPVCDISLTDLPPLKPSLTFTLRPSLGSAFYPLASKNEVEGNQADTTEEQLEVQKTNL